MQWRSSTSCWENWRSCSSLTAADGLKNICARASEEARARVGSCSSQAALQLRRRISSVEARALKGLSVRVGRDAAVGDSERANVAPGTGRCRSALDRVAVTGDAGEGYRYAVLINYKRADAIQARSIFRRNCHDDRGAAEATLAVRYSVGKQVGADEVRGWCVDE